MKRIVFMLSAFLLFAGLSARQKYALLIGISEYTQSDCPPSEDWDNIHGANDIRLLVPTFVKQGFSVDTLTNSDATADNIRNSIKVLESKLNPGDIVYFHFSGHGQPVEDTDGDEEDGWDEAIIPVDAKKRYAKGEYEGENHILDDELNLIFSSLRRKLGPIGCIYAVIDACHAGTMSRGFFDDEFIRGTQEGFGPNGLYFRRPDPRERTTQNFLIPKDYRLADICILEACRADEYNREIRRKGDYYGPLSYYLNKAIQDIILNNETEWIDKIKHSFAEDTALKGEQNIVVESCIK